MTDVLRWYENAQREWDRLDLPLCQIEFASTLELIDSYVFPGQQVVDIGDGPGRYTIELLRRGCQVTLFDLSPQNVVFAQAKIDESGLKADALIPGDARDLSALQGQRFDAILALGPLYHIVERNERVRFLRTAKELLRPRGVLIAAYLNPWGIARTLLADAPSWFEDTANLEVLQSGGGFSGARALSGFTECNWCTPDQAQEEFHDAALTVVDERGAEGFANGGAEQLARIKMQNVALFEKIVAFGVRTSRLPQYRRSTDHYLLVARA